QSNVQGSHRHFHAIDPAHGFRDSLRQGHASAADADERQMFRAAGFLHNFVGQPLNGAIDFGRGHELRLFYDTHSSRNPIIAAALRPMQPCSNIWMVDCQVLLEELRMDAGLTRFFCRANKILAMTLLLVLPAALPIAAQESPARGGAHKTITKDAVRDSSKPKLVVILLVDQMRGDYVDKFQHQWTGGLKRLVNEGAWFHEAAYPYGATETCVGHSTISTGAFPASHGMIGNEWWDREQQKDVTCTADASVKNIAYDGAAAPAASKSAAGTSGATPNAAGDSAAKMLIPAFAEELKFQSGAGTRVVAMSLKARAAITLAGHQADSVTWW